ncbi:MAG TPA: hypothetical protein VGB77_08005 [Abditibacteriaceae bacterium]|jgi:hypothetical protein
MKAKPERHDLYDFPDEIHQTLCALVGIGMFLLLKRFWAIDYPVAIVFSLLFTLASTFLLLPLSLGIYRFFMKRKYGVIPNDARLHTTDAGWAAIIFVLLFLLLVPPIAWRLAWNKKYNAAKTQQEKAALKKELKNLGSQ